MQLLLKQLDAHEGRIATREQVSVLFTTAYKLTTTISVAKNGFAETGILPYQPDVFKHELFLLRMIIKEYNTDTIYWNIADTELRSIVDLYH